jgi:hypothetical protein
VLTVVDEVSVVAELEVPTDDSVEAEVEDDSSVLSLLQATKDDAAIANTKKSFFMFSVFLSFV